MATFKTFKEIEAWQKARELTRVIYNVTKKSSLRKDYGLRDQMQRASVSVMSNIAEGFERGGNKEFVQFLSVAKGSIDEVKSQLYVALDQEYLNKDSFNSLYSLATPIANLIGGLMSYLRGSSYKGMKYK